MAGVPPYTLYTLKRRDKVFAGVSMIGELIHNALDSTPQGFVGVGLIFFYFCIMMWAIVMRIRRGEHIEHAEH